MGNSAQILITGDFYGGDRLEEQVLRKDYDLIFNDFLPIIRKADIAITNLEAPLLKIGSPIKKTGPAIKVIPETINAIKYAGFNILTLANNHIMDYGEVGLQSTLRLCVENNIESVGVGETYIEASQTLFKKVNGLVIAFINMTENEWSTTNSETPGAHPLNPIANFYKIKEAKGKADFVVVIVHGGHEMYHLPSPRMKETYRFFVDAGADVVVGHHTHCFSGFEIYNESPIFFSLGNFLFESKEKKSDLWYSGYAVRFQLNKDNKISFDIIPYKQNYHSTGVRLLTNEEKIYFDREIENLNSVIHDDLLLRSRLNEFIETELSKTYRSFLEPFSSLPVRVFQKLGVLPGLLSKKKKRLYLNLVRCEAHRDVLIKILNDDSNS